MGRIELFLRRHLPLKELGWFAYNEVFTRFSLFKSRWLSIYLHKLDAPIRPSLCHDHPWHFWVFVLGAGYWEEMNGQVTWRDPWSVFYRTARSTHNTVTRAGRPNWSIVVVSKRVRDWSKVGCESAHHWLLNRP